MFRTHEVPRIKAVLDEGVIAHSPVVDIKAVVTDGKEHPVDSKPVAFETAGREAFKLAVESAGPVLFEPIMSVRVTVPDSNMGDVMSDMNSRRGQIQGTDTRGNAQAVEAMVPLLEERADRTRADMGEPNAAERLEGELARIFEIRCYA